MKAFDLSFDDLPMSTPATPPMPPEPMTAQALPGPWDRDLPTLDDPLTARERQVITMLRAGLRRKEIAYELGINVATVRVFLYRAQKRRRAR